MISNGMNGEVLAAAGSVLLACFFFSLMFFLPKIAGADLGWQQVAFIRFASAFICICLFIAVRHKPSQWPGVVASRQPLKHVIRACFGVGAVGCIVYAAGHMHFADVMTISFTKGGFLLLFSAIFLKEAVGLKRCLAIALSFLGAICVIFAQGQSISPAIFTGPAGIALMAAAFIAAEITYLKQASSGDRLMPMLFIVNGTGTALSALLCLLSDQGMPWTGWVPLLLLMGPLAFVGQSLNFLAHCKADATFLAPFAYVTILYSAVLGWIFFGEALTVWGFIGAGFLVASGLVVTRTPANTIVGAQRVDLSVGQRRHSG
ncbi:DMT family transporter [Aestuariispira insulae]|uniref:Drug/metabolite transporter (DMT)-like permease n=1 Tax=Aestuariispira insulae TaxID=1461337 RepID=A0A3D9HWU4_9PROT|nr:DMT family transporter [Aestuariispira insulae]RED53376.1 drug/metabolite transporter (DMT)-like permease [Aestuariispira insulae]